MGLGSTGSINLGVKWAKPLKTEVLGSPLSTRQGCRTLMRRNARKHKARGSRAQQRWVTQSPTRSELFLICVFTDFPPHQVNVILKEPPLAFSKLPIT